MLEMLYHSFFYNLLNRSRARFSGLSPTNVGSFIASRIFLTRVFFSDLIYPDCGDEPAAEMYINES